MYSACIVALILITLNAYSAQKNYNPLPPQVAFISNGRFRGTIRSQFGELQTRGHIAYLAGKTPADFEYERRELQVDLIGGIIEITNTWEVETPSKIDTWEITSVLPDDCFLQTFAGEQFPTCDPWVRTSEGLYLQNCTIFLDGIDLAHLSIAVVLSASNQLVSYTDSITLVGEFIESETLYMESQGSVPPTVVDFTRPSICNSAEKPIHDSSDPRNEHISY